MIKTSRRSLKRFLVNEQQKVYLLFLLFFKMNKKIIKNMKGFLIYLKDKLA